MASTDEHMNWAKEYIIDPLVAKEPSEEDGPGGTHFGNSLAPRKDTSRLPTPPDSAGRATPLSPTIGSNNPFRQSSDLSNGRALSSVRQSGDFSKGGVSSSVRARASSDASNRLSIGPPPTVRSPRHSGQYRQEAFGGYQERPRSSHGHHRNASNASNSSNRSRGDSLNQRPLEFAIDDNKLAHRSPHLRKQHLPGTDSIDKLDVFSYHHEGPYDAALLARNSSYNSSPVAAVEGTNREALRATPRENVMDSIQRHRPLDGTAVIAPGDSDRFGRKYEYKEGDNMMTYDGANYKRWEEITYHPEDYKGKGEPSFSLEKALKEHKIDGDANRRSRDLGDRSAVTQGEATGIEMQGGPIHDGDSELGVRRSGSHRLSVDGLKKRIGSLRRKPVAQSQS